MHSLPYPPNFVSYFLKNIWRPTSASHIVLGMWSTILLKAQESSRKKEQKERKNQGQQTQLGNCTYELSSWDNNCTRSNLTKSQPGGGEAA